MKTRVRLRRPRHVGLVPPRPRRPPGLRRVRDLARHAWARWFGVACSSVNAIVQTLWIPAYPVLAMTILALDIIVIYGLLAYGGRAAAPVARHRARTDTVVPSAGCLE